jgi:peptidoglycan/xylan/chitin deacetylase (PgdA/CDA1 family)
MFVNIIPAMPGPVISFTFDDAPRSAITVGGGILGKHGLEGTYYLCMGLAHTTDDAGEHFGPDDLRWLAANGHEIGCHTFSHLSLRDHSAADIAADLDRNQLALQELLPGFIPRQFAYPYGHISIETWRLVRERFETCRGTQGGIHTVLERFDRLCANSLYETVPMAKNLRLIDQVLEKGGWLIFYTHDIAASPSSFGCTPHYFETVVSKAAASGAAILKIGEAAKRLRTSD